MLPKDRVLAALRREPTDIVPVHHITFSSSVASALLGREAFVGGGIQQWREACALWDGAEAHEAYLKRSFRDAIDVARAVDNDIVRVTYWRLPTVPTARLDERTFRYGPHRVMRFDPPTELYQIVADAPSSSRTLADLRDEVSRMERELLAYEPSAQEFVPETRAQKEIGDEYLVRVSGAAIGLPYEELWLYALGAEPALVERYLDVQAERAVRRLDLLRRLGFVCVWGGGDLAWNEGPFYSPKAFHDLMLPRVRRVSVECHKRGLLHLFGSDGNLWPISDDLFGSSGVDGYFEMDRRAGMDLGRFRRQFPSVTAIGNVSSHTLHHGTVADVEAEVDDCVAAWREHGGAIVGCSNLIMPETPMANVTAMIERLRMYRK